LPQNLTPNLTPSLTGPSSVTLADPTVVDDLVQNRHNKRATA
jgi:hypothetical protein